MGLDPKKIPHSDEVPKPDVEVNGQKPAHLTIKDGKCDGFRAKDYCLPAEEQKAWDAKYLGLGEDL